MSGAVGVGWLTVPVPKASETRSPAAPAVPNVPAAADGRPDVSGLGYEQARDELVSVVARLEAGAETLEESLALWERGEALAARCQEWLDGARRRLSAVRDAGQAPLPTPSDADPADEPELEEQA